MDSNRRPRGKPMQLKPTDLQKRRPKHTIEKTVSSTDVAGKTGYPQV
jgi:hypothetical protein